MIAESVLQEQVYILQETLDLTAKAGIRCAHDFRHAVDYMPNDVRPLFSSRVENWIKIFRRDGPKNYRHELHMEIDRLEDENKRLKDLCEKHGINPANPDGIPF